MAALILLHNDTAYCESNQDKLRQQGSHCGPQKLRGHEAKDSSSTVT